MTITFNGQTVVLSQDPFIDGAAGERPIYKAHGKDEQGRNVIVTWDVVEGWQDIEDESEMCDWDHPSGVLTA